MIHLGLTGSIGMGKSATARMFEKRGIPVHDADAVVHRIYSRGGEAIAPIEWAFPGVTADDGSIDRDKLRAKVVNNSEAMKQLEAIVHPLMGEARTDFLRDAERKSVDIVVFDVPLLFETGGESRLDAVVVVTAPKSVQRERVLARPGMTEETFKAILARQMPDSEKRARADFVVKTGYGFDYAQRQVDEILAVLRGEPLGAEQQDASCEKLPSTPKQPV